MGQGPPPTSGDEVGGAPADAVATAVGAAIASARAGAGLSMRALARLAGVSQPFLSQVEHGAASPSLVTLYRLAAALSLSPSELMPSVGAPEEVHVVRAGEGARVAVSEAADAATGRLLSAGAGHRLVVSEYHVHPGQDLGGWFTTAGEMTVYLVEGVLDVTLAGHGRWRLTRGDAISHPGSIENHWDVVGDAPARVLLSYTPALPLLR